MKAKVQPRDVLMVNVGDVVGLIDYIIGGPATGGAYKVPAIDRGGNTHTVTGLFDKLDAITGTTFKYAKVSAV